MHPIPQQRLHLHYQTFKFRYFKYLLEHFKCPSSKIKLVVSVLHTQMNASIFMMKMLIAYNTFFNGIDLIVLNGIPNTISCCDEDDIKVTNDMSGNMTDDVGGNFDNLGDR